MTDEDLNEPQWIDRTLPSDGTAKTVTGREVLMAAARMQRDGKSLPAIRKELDLLPSSDISDAHLQRALDLGHRLLAAAIARGEEPEESRIRVVETPLLGPNGRPL